jgi:sigma-E factor negative regulatory protein RseB
MAPGWRVASLAAVLGVLGTGIGALVLADGAAGSATPSASSAGQGLIDQASGPGGQPASAPRTAASSAGLRLLRQAVAACQDTPYRGVQEVLWWGQGDPTTSVIDVWHQPGGVTLVRAADPGEADPVSAGSTSAGSTGGGSTGSGSAGPGAAGYPDLDGVLGVSPQLLRLLQANYQVVYAGPGSAAGHTALVVEVRRPGGGVAARFWLDATTKLPLRREIFAADTHVISEDAFTDLELGDRGLSDMPSAAVAPSAVQLGQGSLTALRARGWPLPAQLPGNLALFGATATATSSGQAVGLSYSDGLSVVSLFVQRGLLAGPMPGWQPVSVGGRTLYAVDADDQGDRSLAWSAGGFVYTVVADAPTATVRQVVIALPSGSPPGFWQRMAHGLHRLASWANPLRS